jgi:hypothetical protein
MSRTIAKDALDGIYAAIKTHKPDLLHIIDKIKQSPFEAAPGDGPVTIIGGTVIGTYTASVSEEEGILISHALTGIEMEHGDLIYFNKCLISHLINSWSNFIAT